MAMITRLFRLINRKKRTREWKRRNHHNGTTFANSFNFDCVNIGRYTYGPLTVLNFGGNSKLIIGSFCSIASGVVFNLAGDHYTNHISTFPFKAKVLNRGLNEAYSKGDIIIKDDVWIGQNAIIMSGVQIGQGAVIAAGAVVVSDVPAYAIVGGVPAHVIKYRFSEEMIANLLKIDYSKLTKKLIEEHLSDLYEELKEPCQLDWMPRLNESNRSNNGS